MDLFYNEVRRGKSVTAKRWGVGEHEPLGDIRSIINTTPQQQTRETGRVLAARAIIRGGIDKQHSR